MFLNHLWYYPSTGNLNYLFNLGFFITVFMTIQIVSGLILTLAYLDHYNGFYSVLTILHDVHFGFMFRYIHQNNTSLVMILVFSHMFRQIAYTVYHNQYVYNSGLLIVYVLMAELFLGYLLVWGQISFWGATVITQLLGYIPDFLDWISGDFAISLKTLKRLFIFHFLIGLFVFVLMYVHFFYLHEVGNNGTYLFLTNNKTIIFIYLVKDFLGLMLIYTFATSQYFFHWFRFAHSDNIIEANPKKTPPHIIPEWYFLPEYYILKAIPSKLGGLLVMIGFVIMWIQFDNKSSQSYQMTPVKTLRPWNVILLSVVIMLGILGAQLPMTWQVETGRPLIVLIFVLCNSVHRIELNMYSRR